MVTENYYQKTLNYEEQITKIRNTNALKIKPKFTYNKVKGEILLFIPEVFDSKTTKGKITFFRPSDSKLDQAINLKLDENNIQLIPVSGIVNGKWNVQLSWTDGKQDYYYKQIMVL